MLTITNARLFDGHKMLPGRRSVTLDGNRIVAVGETPDISPADAIDIGGMTLMPGLISCHMHSDFFKYSFANFLAGEQLGKERPPGVLMAIGVRTCRVLLESGFTGFAGAGCSNDIDAQLKMAISEEIIPGPRILASANHVGTTADNNDPRKWWQKFETPGIDTFANGPDALRGLVREQIRRGADIIKIFVSSGHAVPGDRGRRNMAKDEMQAIVDAAHDRGAKVRAHVCHKDLIMESIAMGIDIIDHGDEVDEECIGAMAKAGSFWVPSLLFLQVAIDQQWPDENGSTAYGHSNIRRALPLAQAAGVRILLGDDFGGDPLRHDVGRYGTELALYGTIEGISAQEVLSWGTSNAGQLLVDPPAKLGVVEEGALADLIIVDGDPLADLSIFTRPEETLKAVIRDGALVIDRLPRRAAAAAGDAGARAQLS